MKRTQFLRDGVIAMSALLFGLLLVWAGNNNAIEMIVTGLLMCVPVGGLFFLTRNWPTSDRDPYTSRSDR
jgi:hypothetical protein